MGKGSAPAIFESDVDVDLVPAEPSVLVNTRNPFLWDLLRLDDAGGREGVPSEAQLPKQVPAADCRWLTVVWDGKKPLGKDMPLAPVTLQPASASGVQHPVPVGRHQVQRRARRRFCRGDCDAHRAARR